MAKSKPARKPIYSDKLARRICTLIADGGSLEKIGEMPDMPSRRLMRDWLAENAEFERLYEIARRQRTDALVDEAIEIADSVRGETENAAVQAARLAVDTRKWLASKLLPERYGDRQQVEMTGRDGEPLIPEQIDISKISLMILSILGDARPQAAKTIDAPAEAWRGAAPSPSPAPPPLTGPLSSVFGAAQQPEEPFLTAVREEQRIAASRARRIFDTTSGQVIRLREDR
jgi:hypothetical protein